jgi:HPt (histidine-containing phosphotransfer) domain-containing protein
MERLIVEVDPDLRELIPDFLRRKRADAIAIQIALDKGDFAVVAALGHKLKGEGGGFGFDVITDIGAGLEGTAKNRDGAFLLPGKCRGRVGAGVRRIERARSSSDRYRAASAHRNSSR